jgi:hypothetical protein
MKYLLLSLTLVQLFSCNSEPKNITKNATITASGEYETSKVGNLQDADTKTIWNSGGFGKHWLNFKFDKGYDISKISFANVYNVSSVSSYDILVRKKGSADFENMVSKTELIGSTQQIDLVQNMENIEEVKIVFTNDSSWVAMASVDIMGK